jgi:cytidine deaminase
METISEGKALEHLDNESKYLVHKAKDATAHSYSPYSKFCVGAAVILNDGTVVTGSNQENASYPLCMCAERVALYAASALHPGKSILKMAVVAHKKNHKELVPATSCGACRQVMLEYEERQGKPLKVIMMTGPDVWVECSSVKALMPISFNKSVMH